MRRALLAGAVLAGYLATAALTFSLADIPVRPFFDGNHGGLLPYRWVDPPESEVLFNQPPQTGGGEIRLTKKGSADDDVRTPDLQAGLILPETAFDPGPGKAIEVEIVPLDPDEVGTPPAGQEFQGNAYRFEARYTDDDPAELAADGCDVTAKVYRCATILLTTPFGAVDLARWSGDSWEPLTDPVETNQDIFADTHRLGTFVALAEEGRIASSVALRDGVPTSGTPLRDIIAIALGAFAVIVASIVYRTRTPGAREETLERDGAAGTGGGGILPRVRGAPAPLAGGVVRGGHRAPRRAPRRGHGRLPRRRARLRGGQRRADRDRRGR